MTIARASEDAFGRALLDHHEGRAGDLLLLESDDGSVRPADMQPAGFFAPQPTWPSWERHVVGYAEGAILDLGAGAGRHSLYLQDLGHEVSAVDSSPGAVAVCRSRGIRDVRLADLRRLGGRRRWDTLLLMCGNLGLAGDRECNTALADPARSDDHDGWTVDRRLRRSRKRRSPCPASSPIRGSHVLGGTRSTSHLRRSRLWSRALAGAWKSAIGGDEGYAVVLRRR